MSPAASQSGQGTIEYILLLAAIVSIFVMVRTGLQNSGFSQKLITKLQTDFGNTYRNGHPKAKGYEDAGGPELHPRAVEPGNFRIFFNPRAP